MSFLSVLKTIGHGILVGVGEAQKLSQIISAIPVIGGPAELVINAIMAVEALVPQSGQGVAKKAAVTSIVTSTTPSIDPAALSQAIDDIVAALNSFGIISAKLTATPPAAAPAT